MCKLLKVSRSSFYKFLNKKESKRSLENKEFKSKIIKIYEDRKKCYGAPKIHKTFKTENIHISLKRVQRLMKRLDIKAIVCKKFRPSPSKVKIEDRENILKRDFSTTSINQKWVTDITYIHTIKDGWCYLASVMDPHSKKIIGYSMDRNMDTALAINAVRNAYEVQKPSKPPVLHSDPRSQYTSKDFSRFVLGLKSIHSFSGKGCPYDNACIESFHASLKKEEVNLVQYYDFNDARLAIFEYIESWYNRKRFHSSIGYITPQQCEDLAKVA